LPDYVLKKLLLIHVQPPAQVFAEVTLMAAEERAEYF
jgi:hypothetical protein